MFSCGNSSKTFKQNTEYKVSSHIFQRAEGAEGSRYHVEAPMGSKPDSRSCGCSEEKQIWPRLMWPFRCAHCHYSCNISGSLKRHYNRKHPSEEYANVGSVELAAEALIQQGGLKCPVCSFVYGTKWEFNRHLKNKHGLKVVEIDGDPKWEPAAEMPEERSTQYLHITEAEEDVQGTQAAVAALQDLRYTSESGDRLDPTAVNILQQIIELGTETHDATAVASVVAMAPGTVTVVKQVTEEEPSSNHTVMIQETLQQASVELSEQHHLVVSSDDVEGIETVTVYTQGGEASEFIVYVQEAMQPLEEQAGAQPAQEL
ncbi:zinc finger protein ZFAT-like [Heterocephalus glaber]|uniref:Zinc finger protein ZFAT-like n=1 Tax=Heterocephalus glaber TaxID=10181 RepID=A0AAX6QPB1_HETGA|nr:zinc finger protein ZFAT-like [Heterocephalus glaber]